MRRVPGALVLMTLVVMAACSSGSGRSSTGRSMNVLTLEEITASNYSDAFALVQALRPQWLRVRGSGSISRGEGVVQVYLDGSHMGDANYLRQISTMSIGRIQYLDGLEATQRWGLDHGNGAIAISSRGR